MRSLPVWIPATLLLACIALYSLGLDGALMFDSEEVLVDNAQLHLDPAEFIQWRNAILSTNSGPTGRPVSMLSFAINYALAGGVSSLGFKMGNLLIHCLGAVLAWQFLRRLLASSALVPIARRRREWIALTTAALWLLHPLHVSTVLNAVQRMEQLSALFTLAGLLAYLHYRPRWLSRSATSLELSNCILSVLVFTILAALSKEDGVLLLPLLLLVELFFFRCVYNGKESSALVFVAGLSLYLPILLIMILWLLQPQWLTAGYAGREFNLTGRLLTESRVLWEYLRWIFVPDIRPLALHHDDFVRSASLLQPLTTLVSVLAWAFFLIAAVVTWRRWPIFFFALGWYLICHMMEATVWPLELVYEHRNYLASLAPCLLVSWGIWCAAPRLKRRPRIALAALLLAVLALQLGSRSSLWGDEEQLAAYHLYHHPDSLRSVYHYANTQLRLGEAATDQDTAGRRLGLARQYYEEMLRLDPTDMPALATLLYLDSRYFSSLASARWVSELGQLAGSHEMRRNDLAAMRLLLDCLLQHWCDMPGESYQKMLLSLAERYPKEPLYLDLLANYLGQVEQDYSQALYYHSRLLESHPDYSEARVGLMAWHSRRGDRDQMLEELGGLLRQDSGPVQVRRVKSMLEASRN